MRIVVLVKAVPDSYAERTLHPETGLLDRASGEPVLDEIGERALEAALAHADAHPGTEVTVLAMSPAPAGTALRRALAMGATAAVQVVDEGLVGADLLLTAQTLAAAVRTLGFDLLLAGDRSSDGAAGVIPAMLAELLDAPLLARLETVEIGDGSVAGTSVAADAVTALSAAVPAVVSVTDRLPAGRVPGFSGIVAAKKKPLQVLSLADLGLRADAWLARSAVLLAVAPRPARVPGPRIVDDGDAAVQLADFLLARGVLT